MISSVIHQDLWGVGCVRKKEEVCHESREKIGEPETSQDDISAGPLFVAGMFLRKKIYIGAQT